MLDVRGLLVAPGFVNIHSHAVPAALPTAENMLTQGVTLEILNADGSGPPDIGKQLADIGANGLAINIGANAGFNSAWAAVVAVRIGAHVPDGQVRARHQCAVGTHRWYCAADTHQVRLEGGDASSDSYCYA